MPAQSFEAEMLQVRAVPASTNGICGAFNGSTTCLGGPFGNCCSQFGYCGNSDLHCGSGCQTGFGSCGPQQTQETQQFKNLGCFVDNTNARVLGASVLVPGNTPTKCKAACAERSFTYAGVEFGSQCFCGTGVTQTLVESTGCDYDCPGNSVEKCGGFNAIQIYSTVPTWLSLGCYSDATNSRTLSKSLNIAGNTNEKCQAACLDAGYKYAGTEFGSQCFCGNSIDNAGGPIAQSTCNKACAGDSAASCGGPNALSLFSLL
ncbi:hypothetical protein ACJ41O_006917 [Fusarium nematophilum]